MVNRVVIATPMVVLIILSATTQVACQSTMDRSPVKTMVNANQTCRNAVLKRLRGISTSEIVINEGFPLMQNDFVVMEWKATDRLARGRCRLHEDGSVAEFVTYPPRGFKGKY